MKKVLFVVHCLLMALSLCFLGFESFYSIIRLETHYMWGALATMLVVCGICLFYVIKYKKDKWLSGTLLSGGVLLFLLADMLVYLGVSVWAMIIMTLACGAIFTYLCFVSKFNCVDLVYGSIIFVPMLFLMIFAPIFGFVNIGIKFLVILYVLIWSLLLGKAISNCIHTRKYVQIMSVVAVVLLFVANVVLLCHTFSMVSHKVESIYCIILFIGLMVLVSTCFKFEFEPASSEGFFSRLKSGRWSLVAIGMIMLLVGYGAVITIDTFNLANPKVSKAQFLSLVGDDLNIPLVEINTATGMLPPTKEEYVNASFSITNCGEGIEDVVVEMTENYDDENCVGIKLRGNSTKVLRKKPIRIKFDKKKSLMDLEANKSWVLLADYYDQSYLRNFTAFTLADSFDNLEFTPTPHHVALIMNGNFQGLYLLCEQVDEKEGRTGVDEDYDEDLVGTEANQEYPFLVEMDKEAYKEGTTGVDNFYVEGFEPVEIKFPENDERGRTETTDEVFDYINEYVNAAFKALRTGEKVTLSFRPGQEFGLWDLVEIESAVDYYLMTEIMNNPDSSYKSIYLSKAIDGKMKFGPIWDFDFSMAGDYIVPYNKSHIETANSLTLANISKIFNKMLQDKNFYDAVALRYDQLKSTLIDVSNYLKDYKAIIDNVALIDTRMWHGRTGEMQYDMQYDYVRLYLLDRYVFLDKSFDLPHSEFLKLI
ncbi:MAG: CotH kinase family protein [Clostridia bacterium]|nr:CotH kinase family protein [Clostridia bacterium]